MSKNRPAEPSSESSPEEGPGKTALAGHTVILVEDEPIECKLYTKMLEDVGAEVVSMESPEAMIEASAATKLPSLILTDICGPGKIDGIDLLRRLQQQPEWCRVPALVMTGTPTAERVADASKLPVPPVAFLAKPVAARKLSELVVDVLSDRLPLYVHRRLLRERKAMHMEASQKQRRITRTLAQMMKELALLETRRKAAQAKYRQLSDALNRASQLSPELVGQLRGESEQAQALLGETNEEIQRIDANRTRNSTEKKRHAFSMAKELEAIDDRIRSVHALLKLSPDRKAA